MTQFEIEHWGKQIKVIQFEPKEYNLYYDDELIATITKRADEGRSMWTSPNLDDSTANLVGSIITSKLF